MKFIFRLASSAFKNCRLSTGGYRAQLLCDDKSELCPVCRTQHL